MVVKRQKKSRKYRGTRTCGWGLVHRGSGQKGGAGNAGTGKKANAKAPRAGLWTKQLMGKHGFVSKSRSPADVVINLRDLEDKLSSLLAAKRAAEGGGIVSIDLAKLGYTKVLGAGNVRRKWKITVAQASPDAVEKVKAAGGEIIGVAGEKAGHPAQG